MNTPILGNQPQGPMIDSEMMIRVMRDMTGNEEAFNSPLDRTLIDLFMLMDQAKNVIVLGYMQEEQMRHQLAMKGKRR